MQINVDILSNKQYSTHRSRWSYQLIIKMIIITMLPFWSMSNVISLNQFNHFSWTWTETNIVTAR